MKSLAQIHRQRLKPLYVAVSLLMFHAIVETRAEASCGDWLADSTMSADHQSDSSPGSPCRGLNCRRAPQSPFHQVPVRLSWNVDDDRLCQAERDLPSDSSQPVGWLMELDCRLPDRLPHRLERPPR